MAHLSDEERAFLNEGLPLLRSRMDSEGATFFYRESGGSSSSDAVILLHGLGASSAGWRAVIAGISPDVRVFAWDAPGFGGSTPLHPVHSHEFAHADALKSFCDTHELSKVHVVGSSWGGALAVNFAARHPGYVRSLTLLAPNRCFAWLASADREGLRAQLLDPGFVYDAPKDAFLGMLIAADSDPVVRERAFALKDQLTLAGFRDAVDMMLQTDTLVSAAAITAPTIVLAGELDVLAPTQDHARPVCEAIRGAELRELPDCGHLIELECPHAVITAISEQIARRRHDD